MTNKLLFLGFVIISSVVSLDYHKVRVIKSWLVPKSIQEVISFHGLATFCRRFVKKFSSIMAPINNFLKVGQFKWEEEQDNNFRLIKQKFSFVLVLSLLDFESF